MPNFLMVPMRVDGLYSQGQSALQALADFRFMPYRADHPTDKGFRGIERTDLPRDTNSEVAYISENFVAEPFSDENFWLPTGMHLHWALPDALTIGRHPSNAHGQPDPIQPIQYPPIPNRWLVVRTGGGLPDKKWIVESDYLYSPDDPPTTTMTPVAYPLRTPTDGEPPFCYLGRARELTGAYAEDTGADFLYKHGEALTAPGYGEPNFHAFYPDCYSVLGLYDADITQLAGLEYQVFGWYSNPADDQNKLAHDYFKQFVDDFNAVPPKFLLPDDLVRRMLNIPAGQALTPDDYKNALVRRRLNTPGSRTPAPDDYKTAFLDQLQREFGWQIDQAELQFDTGNLLQIDGMICYARLTFDGSSPTPDPAVTIAVGNTGTEALAAYLAHEQANGDANPQDTKKQYENQLEALTLTVQLQDQTIDLGPKFEEARHTKTFTAVRGGVLWNLRPPVEDKAQPTVGQPARAVALPDDLESQLAALAAQADQALAELLTGANWLQAAYDRGQQVIQSLRRSIYSDWYKYMVCCYRPPDSRESDYPDIDAVKRLIEKEVVELYLAQAFVGQLVVTTDSAQGKAQVSAPPLDQAHFHLDNIPADSIRILGYDLLNRLNQSSPTDDVAELQRQQFFAQAFSDWCAGFVGGAGSSIPTDMIELLGATIYDAADTGYLSRYPPAADGYRAFSSVAALLVAQIGGLSQLVAGLNAVHAAAIAAQPDVHAILSAITSLAGIESLQPTAEPFTAGPLPDTLNSAGADQQKAFATRVAALIPSWLLQPSGAPRFWQPNEPVLLLAGPGMISSDRHGQDGQLPCHIVSQDVRGADDAVIASLRDDLKTLVSFAPRQTDGNPYHPLFVEWEVGMLPIEQHGNVPADARRYGPRFVRDNYLLNETRSEFLRLVAEATLTGSTSVFLGRAILTSHASEALKTSIDQYLADHAQAAVGTLNVARDKLDAADVHLQTQALTGFNVALLMHRQTMQLPIADPLAFPEYRDFTEIVVHDAVRDQNRAAPEPLFDFEPIRSGDMLLMRLRLIDTFGLVHPLEMNQLITTTQMQSPLPWWVALPARITQPARVNFRWLSANDDVQQTNSHMLTSPICGWLVANNLDDSLMIYDADGAPLGYIDEEGRWRSAPGRRGPVLPDDIANPHLARMVKWICATANQLDDPTQFVGDFVDLVDTALQNIEPENFRQHQARVLLISRPVALVRAVVDLQLQGPPAMHMSWEQFRRRLLGQPAKTDQYLEVQFPIRIGEHLQLNDGVVGYWLEQGDQYASQYVLTQAMIDTIGQSEDFKSLVQQQPWLVGQLGTLLNQTWCGTDDFLAALRELPLDDQQVQLDDQQLQQYDQQLQTYGPQLLALAYQGEFLAPQSQYTDKLGQDRNVAISRQDGPPLNFFQSLADPPQYLSILMDPRGLAHCTTGVLPTKALSIPAEHYTEALKNLNVTFLSAPLLTDPGRMNIPLPMEPGYGWSWVQKDGAQWTEITTTPLVPRQALLAAFPDGQDLWDTLIEQGWIAPLPGDPERASVLPKSQRKSPTLNDPREADIQRVLDLAEQVLGQPPDEARFGPAQEIREGWLQLTSTQI